MTHKTKVMVTRVFLGGLLASLLLTGRGGSRGGLTDQIVRARLLRNGRRWWPPPGKILAGQKSLPHISLQDGDGLYYAPDTLDPAFQKGGLRVQFTAIVVNPMVPAAGAGIPISLSSIYAL